MGMFKKSTVLRNFALKSLSAILVPTVGWAAPQSFSWNEMIKKVSESNEELKSSEKDYEAAGYTAKAAYGNFLPQISAALNYTQGKAFTDTSTQTNYDASLTATEYLFSGFQDEARVRQAKGNLSVASGTLQTTKAKVSYDLKYAVASLVYAQNSMKLTQDIIRRRELNLRTVQLRFESGRENRGSYLLSKAYLEDARLASLQAQQSLFVAQEQLAKVLGEEAGEGIAFTGVVPVSEAPSEADANFKKIVLESPTYLQAVAQEDVSMAGVTLARANFFPSLSVSATTGDSGQTWFPNQNRWSVGAALTLPLFSGGKDYYATQSALSTQRSSTLTKTSTLKDQLVKLKSSYSIYSQAVQKVKVDQTYVEASTAREKISREKYNNGLSTFDDWDLIENDMITRQRSLLTSERDRVIAEAAWEQAQGKGVIP